ncbi:hypothetical protein [Kitasatospora sp. NPDC059327]|uniref:hypothetical protein n=1 Tax=Kitasatospora sp. NPDC059327 TaxID=3346803 RepID=UPI0036AB88C0
MSLDRIRYLAALRRFDRDTEPNMPPRQAGETSAAVAMWVHLKGGLLVAVPGAFVALGTGVAPGFGLLGFLCATGAVANASHVSYLRRRC